MSFFNTKIPFMLEMESTGQYKWLLSLFLTTPHPIPHSPHTHTHSIRWNRWQFFTEYFLTHWRNIQTFYQCELSVIFPLNLLSTYYAPDTRLSTGNQQKHDTHGSASQGLQSNRLSKVNSYHSSVISKVSLYKRNF